MSDSKGWIEEAKISDRSWNSRSAFDLPFPDSSFHGVICSDVLEHLNDIPKAVSEIARVLKPGGVVIAEHTLQDCIEKGKARVREITKLLSHVNYSKP